MLLSTRSILLVCILAGLIFSPVIGVTGTKAKDETNILTFLNWAEYMDPELISSFEKKYNAKVVEFFFETDEIKDEMLLQTKGKGFDVVLSTGVRIPGYIKQNWLTKVSETQIPNLIHIDARWRNAQPEIKDFAVPYVWGTLGIVYRKDFIKKQVTSWLDLYRPSENLKGKIVMINDSKETIGMGLKALGYSMNSEDKNHYNEVRELLHQQKPYVFDYSYVVLSQESSLVTGDIWMSMVYNGDGLLLQEQHPQIAFSIPKEGTNLWVDYLVIMEQSKNKKLAFQFINFLNEPENAAQFAEYLMFATPNKAALALLPQEHLDNTMIYPDAETINNSEIDKILSPRIKKMQVTIFNEVTR